MVSGRRRSQHFAVRQDLAASAQPSEPVESAADKTQSESHPRAAETVGTERAASVVDASYASRGRIEAPLSAKHSGSYTAYALERQ